MSKINGLPPHVNYFYGPEIGEPFKFDLFRRPAEDYASLSELEMVAGCVGCHDSDDKSTLIVADGAEYDIDELVRMAHAESAWVADAPADYDRVMNAIPRSPRLIRQVCAGVAAFWLIAIAAIVAVL
jgi:hypothetical protein